MMMMKTIVTTVKVRVMVKVIVTKINFKMILMISDNGDNESDAGDDMMMMMMMMMMMTVKMTMMMLLMMIMMTTMMLMMIMTMMMTVMMMMMLMMMKMMMMMTMIRRWRRDRMKNTNINIAVCIYNSSSIHVRLFSYTCFAPVFIRRSCLISRMINFRSFAVHLKMTKAMICQGK